MNITETDKVKMKILLESALQQFQGVNSISIDVNDKFDIESLIPHLLSDRWPHAVDPLLIADPNSEDDKMSRAHGILSIVVSEPISGKFLDFGCGEGHLVAEVANKGVLSVGYDIVNQKWDHFKSSDKMVLTTSWNDVVKKAPYDYILIYDVIDHLKDEEEAIKELKNIRSVLSDKGKVFLRLHPWCSRHGTHLYLSINKAYLHMCLNDECLDKMGHKYLHTIKIIHPLQTYAKWFEAAGFAQPLSMNVVSEDIEDFFKQPPISGIIKKHWKESYQKNLASGAEFPEWQMRQQFVDCVLQKKT